MTRFVHPTPFLIHPPDDFVHAHPEIRRLSQDLSRKYAGRVVVTDAEIRGMGLALWSALNLGAEFDAARQNAGAAVLAVIVESRVAEVQALPWETLCHPTCGFLGKEPSFTLSRRIEPAQREAAPLPKGPLRVLLFTSMPDDVNPETGRLNVEEEQAQVEEAFFPWITQGMVQLKVPDDGRFSTLKELLATFQPHVLFLSGHGKFHHQPHTGEAPYGEFFFEDETGDSQPVREEQIAQVLVGSWVQVVVLSACESSKAASDSLTNGLAQRISALGIPHVIGMRESILDRASIPFTRALCDELANCERVDWAIQASRLAIQAPFQGIARSETGPAAAEELSLGQWCLPMLIAREPARAVIDWDFQPRVGEEDRFNAALQNISLPARFIGRRAEMRRFQSGLLKGRFHQLLISGPGGQGKTALAGKLALDLQKSGYHVFVWSARPENPWRDFEFEMELALDRTNRETYSYHRPRLADDLQRARIMLKLLLDQYHHKVVFFLDNLEALQDPDTLALDEPTVAAWLSTILAAPGLVVLATSRWEIPRWPGEHLFLSRASYADFLQLAQILALRGQIQSPFLKERAHLRKVYETLGGNCRGLEWFAAATLGMDGGQESAFLERLAKTRSELQADMAIEMVTAHLPANSRTLLARLPVYLDPVPVEGLLKLGLDLPDPPAAFARLLAVSLVEARFEPRWEVVQYQCEPVAVDWLRARNAIDLDPALLNLAADYQVYLLTRERATLAQAVAAHHALRRAERHMQADRLTLDTIVGRLTLDGYYASLLTVWLPRICASRDDRIRAEALGQMGKLNIHIGDYETALAYLQQSLAISQQIGDKAGEGTTLNNISQIYDARGDYETALAYLQQSLAISQQIGDKAGLCATLFNLGHIHLQKNQVKEAVQAWVNVYLVAKQINLAQALQALADLAPRLGLPEGLDGWEMLAQRFQGAEKETASPEMSELEQIDLFVRDLVQAARQSSPKAAQYFAAVSKMAVDPEAPAQYRELGKVLRLFMSGVQHPDLSGLTGEFREIVRRALESGD